MLPVGEWLPAGLAGLGGGKLERMLTFYPVAWKCQPQGPRGENTLVSFAVSFQSEISPFQKCHYFTQFEVLLCKCLQDLLEITCKNTGKKKDIGIE